MRARERYSSKRMLGQSEDASESRHVMRWRTMGSQGYIKHLEATRSKKRFLAGNTAAAGACGWLWTRLPAHRDHEAWEGSLPERGLAMDITAT